MTALGALDSAERERVAECLRQLRDAETTLNAVRGALSTLCADSATHPSETGSEYVEDAGSVMKQSSKSRFNALPARLAHEVANGFSLRIERSESLYRATASESFAGATGETSPRLSTNLAPEASHSTQHRAKIGRRLTNSWQKVDEAANYGVATMDQVILRHGEMKAHSMNFEDWQGIDRKRAVTFQPVCPGLRLPVMHPQGRFRVLWMSVGFVFIVYEVFAIPLFLSYQISPSTEDPLLFALASLINVYFLLDIVACFLTGYVDRLGNVVMSLKRVAPWYMKRGLFLDAVAGIPWEWIPLQKTQSDVKALRIVKAIRLLRLTRLIHLLKLKGSMDSLEAFVEANKIFGFALGVLKTVSMLFAVTHWAACIWNIVGSESEDERIAANLLVDLSTPERYLYALYFSWTTMTTVGYGDITPMNFQEIIFVTVLLFVSSVIFAYLMGSLTDLISNLNSSRHLLSEKKTQLSRYMHWRQVPHELMIRIRKHLLFLWDTNAGYDAYECEVKEVLSPVLKTELNYHIYGRIIARAPFLSWMKDYPICVKHLSNTISSIFLEAGDQVFQMGQCNEQIYILLTGFVWLSRNSRLFDTSASPTEKPNEGGGLGMAIPRNSDNTFNVEEAFKDIFSRVQAPKKGTEKDADHIPAVQDSPQAATFALAMVRSNSSLGNTKRTPQTRTYFGQAQTGNSIFDSQVLTDAMIKLRREDLRTRRAAVVVQKRWRDSVKRKAHKKSKSGKSAASKMVSKIIEAPAFFGESCLWEPIETWKDEQLAPIYVYGTQCKTRCELVYIPRLAVLDVVCHFSPWLQERFEFFRKAVLESTTPDASGGTERVQAPVDWAAEGLDIVPTDEVSLQASHYQTLQRQGSRLLPTVPRQGSRLLRTFSGDWNAASKGVPNGPSVYHGPALPRTGPYRPQFQHSASYVMNDHTKLTEGMEAKVWSLDAA